MGVTPGVNQGRSSRWRALRIFREPVVDFLIAVGLVEERAGGERKKLADTTPLENRLLGSGSGRSVEVGLVRTGKCVSAGLPLSSMQLGGLAL